MAPVPTLNGCADARLQQPGHGGALDDEREQGLRAHEEHRQRAEALVADLAVQQHEERQRQPHRAAQA